MHIFSGQYKGRPILSPKGLKTRPTSGRLRETLFNICQGCDGVRFLDLFAGSGGMGLEALSRGGEFSTLIDNSRESIRCIQANVRALKVEKQAEIIYGDVFEHLHKLAKRAQPYDIIYADPPYDQVNPNFPGFFTYSACVLKIIDEIGPMLLKPNGFLFLEDAPKALPKGIELQSLVLKSSREMGRSALQHYIAKSFSN